MGASLGVGCCTQRVKHEDDARPGSQEDKEDAFLLATNQMPLPNSLPGENHGQASLPGSTRTSSEVAEAEPAGAPRGAEVAPAPAAADAAPAAMDTTAAACDTAAASTAAAEPATSAEVLDVPSDGAAPPPLTRMDTEPDEAPHANIGAPPSLRISDSKALHLGSNGPASPATSSPGTSIGQTFLQFRSLSNWFNNPVSPDHNKAVDDKTLAGNTATDQPPVAEQGNKWMATSLNKWYCGTAELPEHQTVLEQHEEDQEDNSPDGLFSRNLSHFYDLSVEDQQPQQPDRSGSFLQVRAGAS